MINGSGILLKSSFIRTTNRTIMSMISGVVGVGAIAGDSGTMSREMADIWSRQPGSLKTQDRLKSTYIVCVFMW